MQQLDIFADSVPVQRANDLVAALGRFDHAAAERALQALILADPEYAGLSHFRVLCEFVDGWPVACDDLRRQPAAPAVAAARQVIEERIVPASASMGEAGRALLRKVWSDLARISEAAGIGPEARDGFAAELYLRAHQPREAVRMARGVPGAARRAVVQRWLALGYCAGGESEPARAAVLRYAWLAPGRFGALIEEMRDAVLVHDWRDFQADLGDLDATWFPAWCAHEKRAGAAVLDNLPPGDGAMAYHLVVGLLIRERGGLCPAVYEDRARLKRLSDSFFAFYLQRRSAPHSRNG